MKLSYQLENDQLWYDDSCIIKILILSNSIMFHNLDHIPEAQIML